MTLRLHIRNRQRRERLRVRPVRSILERTIERYFKLYSSIHVSLEFLSSKSMAEINERHLAHAGPTDVITFDYTEAHENETLAGDILICPDVAKQQAQEFQTSRQSELMRYAVHGFLHLAGHDDRSEIDRRRMKVEENRIMRWVNGQEELESVWRMETENG